MKNFKNSKKGFTLVELIIAVTIFGIMSIMTVLIYFNISESSRRLQISRELSESARQITERISQEILENKIFDSSEVPGFAETDFLGIGKDEEEKVFIFGKKISENSIAICDENDKNDNEVECGLYMRTAKEGTSPTEYNYFNLLDSFRANESEKRVKITDLKFKISGENSDIKKATLKMTLSLTKKAGIPNSLINGTKMEIQSTFSQRFYK